MSDPPHLPCNVYMALLADADDVSPCHCANDETL